MKNLYYFLITLGSLIMGFVIAGLLASNRIEDLERENIHLEFEKNRLEKIINGGKS
jgi:uncharacterized integral membrane protein